MSRIFVLPYAPLLSGRFCLKGFVLGLFGLAVFFLLCCFVVFCCLFLLDWSATE